MSEQKAGVTNGFPCQIKYLRSDDFKKHNKAENIEKFDEIMNKEKLTKKK